MNLLILVHACIKLVIPLLQVDPQEPVPLDGGLAFLFGAGILYGIKKLIEKNKRNHNY